MKRLKFLIATAVLLTTVASPVLASDMIQSGDAFYDQRTGAYHRYRDAYADRSGYDSYRAPYRNNDHRYATVYETRNSGFWPGNVAAGIVGGAIGTAGAIAGGAVDTAGALVTAPFHAGSYAASGFYHENDFACQPGTHFRGQDGLWYLCQ